jgi:uncharacterized protein (TIGR02300 family)
MSPARKRSTKGARKTTKKAARKAPAKKAPKAGARKKTTKASAKSASGRKTPRKAAKKTTKRDAKKSTAKPSASTTPSKPSTAGAGKKRATSATRRAKPARRQPRQGVAQPIESAEKKPELGAKWACFSCGAKFYDLNRPDPICPKCNTDQREQPAKTAAVVAPRPTKRPAAPPITRLLDEEEASEPVFEEDSEAETAAELDIGKFDEGDRYLDDAEFNEDSDD